MSASILNSNASSALISSLDAVSTAKNPFVYSYASKATLGYSHIPAHARVVSVSQATSIGFNQRCLFSVLKSGMLENAFIKMTLTNGTGAVADWSPSIGNMQIEEIQLLTQGKVICSSKPFGRACLMSDAPYGRRINQEKCFGLTGAEDPLAVAGARTYYVPLGFAAFDCPANFIDTNFTEPLSISVRLAAANTYCSTRADPSVAVACVLTTLELVQVFRMLPSELESKTIQENYSEADLVKVEWDLVEEETQATPTAAVSRDFSHIITTNRVIQKLYVALEDTDVAATTQLNSSALGEYLELSNIKVEANGQAVIDYDAKFVGLCMGTDAGSSNSPNCVGGFDSSDYEHVKNIYCIDFGLLKGTDTISGAISARELNNFKITVTSSAATALTATPHNLKVCMVCPQLNSTSSASGKVSTSLSS
tara:strand:+ start:6711 stop:7982 length:1272 start_codon:yes stop_codon:yes gene_type:complete